MCEKRMYTFMCNWVTMLYSRKLTGHCKPVLTEENKIMDLENRLVVANGEGEGVGGTGSLG